ncbi:ATP-binding protein [Candidatus Magnetaquicoccus inordinatus]|uniref:ATP-binding protein n=1 Tax=Candidatus Magnetaquicoccus inordinatus TaxID=2496818 RepID=UPI00102B607F|nr:ATP-binding protein [Candidatus Magnetaquicoccus inordinatus]
MRYVKMNWINSLGLKVLLAYIAGVSLSITLVVIFAVVALQSDLLARIDVANLAEDMANKIRFDNNGNPIGFDARRDNFTWVYETLQQETAYRILDDAGNMIIRSNIDKSFWPTQGDLLRLAPGRFSFEHNELTMYGGTGTVKHEGKIWYLQVAASMRLMNLLHRVALPLVVTGIALFSLVLLCAFGVSAYITLRYTLKPLRDISESAAKISPRYLHTRLHTKAIPAEIAPLIDSFNQVLERLEQGYRTQQEFLGNVAHELKTPLTLIRAQIELHHLGESNGNTLLDDVEYMTRQVQQLLLLAEAVEVHNYTFTKVRIHNIVDEVIAYLQRMAESANILLTVSATDDALWQADRGALFTLLKNLLENAIQHAPANTAVSVEIANNMVTVRDSGPGVDNADLPLLFERFWRGAHRRDHGAGLGLAICKEIACAHGWQLLALQAKPGLQFQLSR